MKVTQLCPWNSPGQNTGVGSLSLLQGIFPTQGSNPGLPHCRRILYQLSHKGSPIFNIVVLYSILYLPCFSFNIFSLSASIWKISLCFISRLPLSLHLCLTWHFIPCFEFSIYMAIFLISRCSDWFFFKITTSSLFHDILIHDSSSSFF